MKSYRIITIRNQGGIETTILQHIVASIVFHLASPIIKTRIYYNKNYEIHENRAFENKSFIDVRPKIESY
jgi:hypothetical protein